MIENNCDDIVLALQSAPVDSRTGNKVIYNACWEATEESMIGVRNPDWVRRELEWFISGSNSLSDMEPPVPAAFQECAGEDNTVNSAYGHILFGEGEELPGGDCLYDRIVNTLVSEGLHTRHAVAIISDRDVHSLYRKNGRKDFICTNAINVMVTEDNQLNITAQMRSMDAVWGYRADYSMWKCLLEDLVTDLRPHYPKITEGKIYFQVANLHVYPRHFELLAKEADFVEDKLNRLARRQWLDRHVLNNTENNN